MMDEKIKLEVLKNVFKEVFGERINFINVKPLKEQTYDAEIEKHSKVEEEERKDG